VYEAQPISNAENTIHIQRHGEILICKAIDLNMGYYSMPLPDQAKKLCVLSLPWVFYQYNILPQGIIPAIDIFRREWEHFFYMPVVIIYMDDTIVFGYADFGTHLGWLQAAGTKNYLWFQPSVTYLGFLITKDGIKPQPGKVQGMLSMQQPKTQKDV
jgi:hypothetical protein